MRRARGLGSVVLLGVLTAPFTLAAEPTPSEDEQAESAAAADRTTGAPSAQDGTSPAQPSEEVFKPTEEISEDFAVPFPVDI